MFYRGHKNMASLSRGNQNWDVTAEQMGPGEEAALSAEAQIKLEEGPRGQAQPLLWPPGLRATGCVFSQFLHTAVC